MPADFFLLRGLAREARHWGAFVPALQSQSYCKNVYAIDLPGTGKFSEITSPLSVQENAQFVASQLDHYLDQPRVLVAVSLGAMVGAELMTLRPHAFKKAFLINTSFKNLSPFYHRLQLTGLRQMINIGRAYGDPEKKEREVLKMISTNQAKWPEVIELWARLAREKPIKLSTLFRQLIAASTYNVSLEAPQTPVVLFNGAQDKMVHPSCSQRLAEQWGVPLLTSATAGHDLCVDDTEWVLEMIGKNLADH